MTEKSGVMGNVVSESERHFGEFLALIQDMQTLAREIVDPICAKHGINRLSLVMLNELSRNPNLSPTKLSEFLNVQRTNLTTQCRKLEEKGFVRRIQSQSDKRSCSLAVTEKGQQVLDEIRGAIFETEKQISALIPEEVRENFERSLRAMRESLAVIVSNL